MKTSLHHAPDPKTRATLVAAATNARPAKSPILGKGQTPSATQ
jgi:hypothetical protein